MQRIAERGTRPGKRTPGGYFRWLRVCLALGRLGFGAVCGGGIAGALSALSGRLIATRSADQELLLRGLPGLVGVPEALFSLPAQPFPPFSNREELLAALRALEERSGGRFDWDAFLSACEGRNRRSRALLGLSERLRRCAPPLTDTSSAMAALASLAQESAAERMKTI